MAGLEVPIILVQSNESADRISNMKKQQQGSVRTQRSLSKPPEVDVVTGGGCVGNTDQQQPLLDAITSPCSEGQKQHVEEPRVSNGMLLQRSRTNSKVKLLVRSQAIRESTSPPRDPQSTVVHSTTDTVTLNNNNNLGDVTTKGTTTDNVTGQQQCNVTTTSDLNCSSDINEEVTSTTISQQQLNNSPQVLEINIESVAQTNDEVNCNNSSLENNSSNTTVKGKCQSCDRDCNCGRNINNNNNKNSAKGHKCQNCERECGCVKGGGDRMVNGVGNTLTVSRANMKNKLKHQTSSQSSFDSSSASPCLSRDSSMEQYTDTTGVNLTDFIQTTINKNPKDRQLMLKIEQELVTLAKDKSKYHYRFPQMSSYQRMLVHRCAAHFGMDHNVESTGKCVIVNKTKSTRIPDVRFGDYIRADLLFPEEPRRSILKRDSSSFEDCKSPDRQMSMENRRSKSFEEREEEYEKARRRIFEDEFDWPDIPWSSTDSDNITRMRLIPPDHQNLRSNRLLKGQSVESKDASRPCVSKSYSFGGYTGAQQISVLSRGNSFTSTHSANARLFTKQDSSASTISWRLSPSSSGYKSQSQRSDSVTPSPTATPYPHSKSLDEPQHQHQHQQQLMSWAEHCASQPVVWAYHHQQVPIYPGEKPPPNHHHTNAPIMWTVGSPMHMTVPAAVPPPPPPPQQYHQEAAPTDVVVVNGTTQYDEQEQPSPEPPSSHHEADGAESPDTVEATSVASAPSMTQSNNEQTGQPFTNQDGTIYHFDPSHPPPSLGQQTQGTTAVQDQIPVTQGGANNTVSQRTNGNSYHNKGGGYKGGVKQTSPPPSVPRKQEQTNVIKQYSVSSSTPPNKQTSPPAFNKAPQSNKHAGGLQGAKQQSTLTRQFSKDKPENGGGYQSPKKVIKAHKMSNSSSTNPGKPPLKSGFTNSSTSPSLPFTPPVAQQQPTAAQFSNGAAMAYHQHQQQQHHQQQQQQHSAYGQMDGMQAFQTYPGYATAGPGTGAMVPVQETGAMVPVYQGGAAGHQPQMVYGYTTVPVSQQFERMDNSVSEMSGYFMNMNVSGDGSGGGGGGNPGAYQQPAYWGPQPVVYYVPPTGAQPGQRYSIPVMQGPTGGYVQTYATQPSAGPSYPGTGAAHPAGSELVPVYSAAPNGAAIVYGPPPTNDVTYPVNVTGVPHGPTVMYATAPPPGQPHGAGSNIMYAQTAPPAAMYNAQYPGAGANGGAMTPAPQYPPLTNTPGSSYGGGPPTQYVSDGGGKNRQGAKFQAPLKSRGTPNSQAPVSSNAGSSVSSNSPASTVVQTYYQSSATNGPSVSSNGMLMNGQTYGQQTCGSPTTPPNAGGVYGATVPAPYGYPQYPPQSYGPAPPMVPAGPPPPPQVQHQSTMVYRSGGIQIRASPPVNPRTSRSPTPCGEHYERNNRFSMPPTLYQGVSCIIPDIRYMPPRQQTPTYRNTYGGRPPSVPQPSNDGAMGRPPRVKKTGKSKPNNAAALPPSGR